MNLNATTLPPGSDRVSSQPESCCSSGLRGSILGGVFTALRAASRTAAPGTWLQLLWHFNSERSLPRNKRKMMRQGTAARSPRALRGRQPRLREGSVNHERFLHSLSWLKSHPQSWHPFDSHECKHATSLAPSCLVRAEATPGAAPKTWTVRSAAWPDNERLWLKSLRSSMFDAPSY